MKEIKPTLPPAPTTGRVRASALDAKRDYGDAPTDPLFMPEEHAVAVMRNEDNPITSAVRMLQAMENGEVGTVAEGHWYALANGLEKYQAEKADAFKQLQARLDIAERAHAKFIDDVARWVGVEPMPDSDFSEYVLDKLRELSESKAKPEAYAGFSREDIVGFVESMAKEFNVTEITSSLKQTPLRAIRTLVETVAKRKSPTALRNELTIQTQQIECLTAALRHIGRAVGAGEWALGADERATVAHIVKCFDKLVGEKQEAEHQFIQMESTLRNAQSEITAAKERGIDELRELVSEFNGGLVDNPMEALRDMLETLTKNQKPDGMDANVQTVITANARLYATLQAIEAVIQTSKV